MDIVTNESVTALARTLGNKRGWKARMPAMAPGLPAGGTWSQERIGGRVRLRYQVAPDQKQHIIGEWRENEPAMPPTTNGTGPRPAPAPRAPDPEPEPVAMEPLIMLTPAGDGAWRLNGYGVERLEVIRALRLALVHLVARQSGVLIIDEVIAAEMAVVAERSPRVPEPRNDRKRARSGKVKQTTRYPDNDLIDDDDEAW